MAAELDYHKAGDAYCDCPIGENHESNDPEADVAWDRSGPMGLAQLYSERKDARISQLEADLAAAQARGAQIEARARAVAAEYERHGRCVVAMSMDTETATGLLDALAETLEGGGT